MAKDAKKPTNAMDFLKNLKKAEVQRVYVLFGDQDFLKQQCRAAIVKKVLGNADTSFAVSSYPGENLNFSILRNELDTLPFLATARVVFIEQAEDFISDNRVSLEEYLSKPSKIGVLVLEPKSFPDNTRLAKALPGEAKIDVSAPKDEELPDWCMAHANNLNKKLKPDSARLLVRRVGAHLGLLAQEIEKLSLAVAGDEITPEIIEQQVAITREANVFEVMTLIGQNRPTMALKLLHELLETEDPQAIIGPIAAQLRRLADVERHLQRGQPLGAAMDAAGVTRYPRFRAETEQQLRHLGRKRLEQLPQWLLELDLGLKGGSPLPRPLQLERFMAKLASPRPG